MHLESRHDVSTRSSTCQKKKKHRSSFFLAGASVGKTTRQAGDYCWPSTKPACNGPRTNSFPAHPTRFGSLLPPHSLRRLRRPQRLDVDVDLARPLLRAVRLGAVVADPAEPHTCLVPWRRCRFPCVRALGAGDRRGTPAPLRGWLAALTTSASCSRNFLTRVLPVIEGEVHCAALCAGLAV